MKWKTPFEAYSKHKLDVSNLRVFGSTAWAQIPLDKRRDLQPQSIECVFIRYPDEYKGFNILDIKTKHIIIEMSVMFDEPLQEVELVKEKTVEFPSYSIEYLDDEIWGDDHYLVFKIKKSLYGLKQAPREWDSKMDSFLLLQNFQWCKSDPNVYI